jgi:hypothetical protein
LPGRERWGIHVLVTSGHAPVQEQYDVVVIDPTRSLAKRYGLKQGGTVVIRPDGYLGAVIDIADDTKLSRYFAQLKS